MRSRGRIHLDAVGFSAMPDGHDINDVRVKSSPGNIGFPCNEFADQLADEEGHNPHPPCGKAAFPRPIGCDP
jgi:hypothetical protein